MRSFTLLIAFSSFFLSSTHALERQLALTSRETQSVEQVCQVILASGTLFPTCLCGPDGDTGNIRLSCDDFCEICLDDADVCVQYSYFVRYSFFNASRIYASFFRFQENQTGVDSSNAVLVRERTLSGDLIPIACNTTINDEVCNSCQINPACSEGFLHDCTNLGVESTVDTCDEAGNQEDLLLDNPFVVLRQDLFDSAECREAPSAAPTTAPSAVAPKKVPPPAESKDDNKLFNQNDFDVDRGGLARKLRSPRGG